MKGDNPLKRHPVARIKGGWTSLEDSCLVK
jgi:hypothetical protein